MRIALACLLSLASFCGLAAAAEKTAAEAPSAKIRVLLTYGGHGFEQKPFFEMFDAMPGVTYTKAELPKQADLLKPGLEKDCDVLVMYDMVGRISPEQQQAFQDLLQRGIGVVSLHHNMGAHRNWDEWKKIIGGKFIFEATEIGGRKYVKSGWAHGQDMKVAVVAKDHPITKGVGDFAIHDETYNNYYVAPDVTVLLKTDHPKNEPTIAWVTQYGRSRVFYLMLGHDAKAWQQPEFQKLLVQGIGWAAGK